MRKIIKKGVIVLLTSLVLFIDLFSVSVNANEYNGNNIAQDILQVLTVVAQGLGIVGGIVNGNASDVFEGLRLYCEEGDYFITHPGANLMDYYNEFYHVDQSTGDVTIDGELYNLIVNYIKGLQSDPNSGVSSVEYKLLRVDKMVYGNTAGDGSDNYYNTYAGSLATGQTIYSLNDIRNIIDDHGIAGITNLNGNLRHKFNLRQCVDTSLENFPNIKGQYDELTGFYAVKPVYRYQNYTEKKYITNINTTLNSVGQICLHNHIVDNRYGGFYIVGSFTNEFTTKDYSFTFYQYNSANDTLVQCNRNFQCNADCKMRRYTANGTNYLEFSCTRQNESISSTNLFISNVLGQQQQNKEFLDTIGKGDHWNKIDENTYYIPLIRSDNPGLYKVFPDTTTLLRYIHNGGNTNIVNNNKTVNSVTIHNNTNNITYVYQPDNVTYPDDGVDNPTVNYDEQFTAIFRELNEIKLMITNINNNGSSGSDVDLSNIEELLEGISDYLEDLEVDPEVNVEVNCPWDESSRNQLLADIATIKSDLASIKTMLQGISSNINTNLPAILVELQNIKDTLDNLDLSGGGITENQLTALINKMNEIKLAISNNNVTVSGNSCNWSDNDISTLMQKINTILGDLTLIEGYLNYMELNQQESSGLLSQILFHVASIDTKMNIKKKVTDTDDNLTWLIHQLTNFLDNNMQIPESIMEMLGLKFPFSIPYILVAVTHLLEAPPEAPVFRVPINLPNVSSSNIVNAESSFFTANSETGDYDFILDFSEFSEVAEAFKFFMFLTWIMGLIKLTPAMLGNGKEIVDEK